jgi:6,7-dimethyl-8-ribityllumazine synthase
VSAGRYAIVISRYYAELAERLETGARAAFAEAGVEDVALFEVAGAFELPLGAKYAAESGQYDGVVCLGVVIRGETTHYDHVCEETARGIMDVQLRTGVPVGFGVVTVENADQAYARTGGGKRDEGRHAAEAALRMAALRRELSGATTS